MDKERLQKVIARSGLTSRRKAEEYIANGRVQVNGKTITSLGTKVASTDKIAVDHIPIEKEKLVYYILNKPRQIISAVSDDRGRKTVIHLMEEVQERVYPIGRLDYQSSGLLLLTNDGNFAHLLMHPKHEIRKEYIVKVKGNPRKHELEGLLKGIKDKGELLRAIQFRIMSVNSKQKTTILKIVLHEGKNRQIRRMLEQLGYPVLKLKREKYGMITLGNLQPGEYRALTHQEIHQMRTLAKSNYQ